MDEQIDNQCSTNGLFITLILRGGCTWVLIGPKRVFTQRAWAKRRWFRCYWLRWRSVHEHEIFWDLFSTGRLTSTVTCTTCGTISTTDDPFDALLLQFPLRHHDSDQDCTVEDLIAHHCEIENISDYQCDRCNGRMLGKKVLAITTCPPILCIVLGRKKQDGGSIKSSVQFPLLAST